MLLPRLEEAQKVEGMGGRCAATSPLFARVVLVIDKSWLDFGGTKMGKGWWQEVPP